MYHSREVYHVLDWIGDMGGLFDGLKGIVEIVMGLVSLLGYKPVHAFLVNSVYSPIKLNKNKKKKKKDNSRQIISEPEQTEIDGKVEKKAHQEHYRDCWILRCLPVQKRKYRIMKDKLHFLKKELDVSYFIKTQKVLWEGFKKLYTNQEIKDFQVESLKFDQDRKETVEIAETNFAFRTISVQPSANMSVKSENHYNSQSISHNHDDSMRESDHNITLKNS